jgi:hypothetical protein
MADLAFFSTGLLIGLYAGFVCKKNKIDLMPQTIDLGRFGAKGDIDK